jgi:hypothetical protein
VLTAGPVPLLDPGDDADGFTPVDLASYDDEALYRSGFGG